jgi:hypothetical protein
MSDSEQSWPEAWEPLTPRGVAAFAHASHGRLLFVQFLVALLAATSVVWFLERAWFPVVRDAIHQLPEKGELSHAALKWTGDTPQQLAENNFLGIAVDLYHSNKLGRAAHLQLEFGQDDFRIYSLLGYQVLEYPPDWDFPFNRTELEPWWGAWDPWIATIVFVTVVIGLMITWNALAVLYWLPMRVISFVENRDLDWAQNWRLASASTLPGALFLITGIIAYEAGMMDLIRLGGMMGLHFVIGWIYLFVSPMFCPRADAVKKAGKNPFAASAPTEAKASDNPFVKDK